MKKRRNKTRRRVNGRGKARWKREVELNVRPPAHPSQSDPRFEYGKVRVADVLIRPDHDELDDGLVSALAESPGGPFTPIIVRRIPPEEQPEPGGHKVELIRGRQRLEAARLRRMKWIKCIYFTGTEKAARIIGLEEDLFRKHQTKLRRAEKLAQWADSLPTIGYRIYGQVVRKRLGRPPKWLKGAMIDLPAIGRTAEARRKKIERAKKIAAIAPEAKDIIIKTRGLANNQQALLAIARESGAKAQVRKAEELAGKAQELRQMTKTAPPRSRKSKLQQGGADETPPLQPTLDTETEVAEDDLDEEPTPPERPKDTTIEELNDFWKGRGRTLWKYAPFEVRRDFMEKLQRAPYGAKSDIVEFINKIFFGRELVLARELYPYAKTRGISKRLLRYYLRDYGYKRAKKGREPGALWFYRNKDSQWKEQVRLVLDAELAAPFAAERDAKKHDDQFDDILDELPRGPKEAYYMDI
jgi:ParB-like chromosome segregation protein Spo0J